MTGTRATSLLFLFQSKIEEAVGFVPNMHAEEKLKAVQFWNVVSEKLQDIVNSSADINALALKFESDSPDKMTLDIDSETAITMISQNNACSSEFTHLQSSFPEEPVDQSHYENNNSHIKEFLSLGNLSLAKNQNEITGALPHIHQLSPEIDFPGNLTKDCCAPIVTADFLNPQTVSNSDCVKFVENSQLSQNPKLEPGVGLNIFQSNKQIPVKKKKQQKKIKFKSKIQTISSVVISDKTASGTKNSNVSSPQLVTKLSKSSFKKTKCEKQSKIIVKNENVLHDYGKGPSALPDVPVSESSKDSLSEDRSSNGNLAGLASAEHVVSFVVSNSEEIIANNEENEDKVSVKKNGSRYMCNMCEEQFEEASSLINHQCSNAKPFFCDECPAQFATKGNLTVHLRKHTGEKPYGCPQCCSRFTTKGNLKRHIKTHSGEKPWHCDECNSCFTEKKSLNVHMRRHTGEKPYQCQVCGKRFAQTGILQTHMAMHNDQKAHLCEHCGKSFRQKSQLRLHKLRHEGVKKYICLSCSARFLTKGDLERHTRMHTGVRPFICEFCNKGFTRQQSLNEHVNRHYGLTPYKCKYCDKSFAEMSGCYKHIKQHERYETDVFKSDDSENFLQESTSGPELCISSTRSVDHKLQEEFSQVQSKNFTLILNASTNNIDINQDETNQAITLIASHSVEENNTNRITDFTAISLLANASTHQQTF